MAMEGDLEDATVMTTLEGAAEGPLPFLDLTVQYSALQEEIDPAIRDVMRSGSFVMGRVGCKFEKEFAAYCEVDHAVGVGNGTDALTLALRALGVGAGNEVICPVNSFIATAEAISLTGATPVFADVEPETATIDVESVRDRLTARTRALVLVHLWGQPADLRPLLSLAAERGIDVVEDACQAHGARYQGRRIGSFGRLGCFSFYPTKNLGAYGDGGMVVTDDSVLAEKVRQLANHGQLRGAKYEHTVVGMNSRLDEIQAAILRVKLPHLEEWNRRRRWLASRYTERLRGISGLTTPTEAPERSSVWHLYVVRTERRDVLREGLAARKIATGIHYPVPLHLVGAYSHLGYSKGDFPVAEALARQILSLPLYPEMPEVTVDRIAGAVRDVLAE